MSIVSSIKSKNKSQITYPYVVTIKHYVLYTYRYKNVNTKKLIQTCRRSKIVFSHINNINNKQMLVII